MKGQGLFRRVMDKARRAMGMPVKRHLSELQNIAPEQRRPKTVRYRRKNDARPMIRRGNLGYPRKCEPGTINYHDMLVRKYGRKKADQIQRDWAHKDDFGNRDRLDRMPNASQLALRGDWDWLTQ